MTRLTIYFLQDLPESTPLKERVTIECNLNVPPLFSSLPKVYGCACAVLSLTVWRSDGHLVTPHGGQVCYVALACPLHRDREKWREGNFEATRT